MNSKVGAAVLEYAALLVCPNNTARYLGFTKQSFPVAVISIPRYLVNSKQIVLLVAKRILQSLHSCQNLFLLQSPANHLHANGQSMHGFRIVQFICALCNSVQFLDVEASWQAIQSLINMSNRYDASGVIKLRSGGQVSS